MIGIKEVVNNLRSTIIEGLRAPAKVIPAIIMICSLVKRPGLSCMHSTARIIDELGKQGFPTEPLPDGSPNLMNKIVQSTVCEVYRALKEDANLQVALSPGSIVVQTNGSCAVGPVTTVGSNINAAKGVALIQ